MDFLRLLLLPAVALLAGCLSNQKPQDPIAMESHALLNYQQALLSDHRLRLDELSETQDELLLQYEEIQKQLVDLGRQMSRVSRSAGVEEKPTDSVPTLRNAEPGEEELADPSKAILGRVEYVWIEDVREYLKARVDTGSKSSSINAHNIQRFERNGKPWIRFDIRSKDHSSTMEAPLERYVRIRQASTARMERRPVVKIAIQLGELSEETEFTLSSRQGMLYPVLLGRSFLQDIALVDVAKKFTRRRDPKLMARVERK